jgi:leader peptidase (prepilin peptidase)/N-methyltransferase
VVSIELPTWFIVVFAFAFGAAWGSFANVVVYRWPLELSVAHPPSHCPFCKHPIRAYDNVPVFAWLWLRGKCRDCGAKISPRYPLIELAFGLLAVAVAWRAFRGDGAQMAAWASFVHALVRFSVVFALGVVALIDLERTEVPNFVLLFAIAPLIAGWVLPPLAPSVDWLTGLAGAGLGYFGLRLLFIDGVKLLIGRPGMGLGDAHVLVVVGALLGPSGVLFALGAGAVQGVIAAAIAAATGRRIGAEDVDEVEDEDQDQDQDQDDSAHESVVPEDEPSENAPATIERSETAGETEAATATGRKPMKLPFVPFLALGTLEYLLGADVALARWLDP